MGKKQYFVYIVTNARHTVLYIGVTNSLQNRVWQHKNKLNDGFTARYYCDRLVYFEVYDRPTDAIAREKQIKGWRRDRKNLLVAEANPQWLDLAADWFNEQVIEDRT